MNKSYLKYAGSKARIIDSIVSAIGDVKGTLIEPFVGSGTVALNVDAPHYILNDINFDVISSHIEVCNNPEGLIEELSTLYDRGRADYYEIRDLFNSRTQSTLWDSAAFIYMNKHGFNGMCRYNSSGRFNIPVGKSKTIHHPGEEILNFGKKLKDAEFLNKSFEKMFDLAEEGDVLYCDPPYVPASATLSDINYTGEGFSFEQQQQLADLALEASKRGVRCVVSNHDIPVTRKLYEHADDIYEVEVFRSISSGKRGTVKELIAIYEAK